jgi:YHS domain-containing protein
MKRNHWISLGAAVLALGLWTSAWAKAGKKAPAAQAATVPAQAVAHAASATAKPFLQPVPKDEICMVQKYFMGGGKLTPVPLDGKTYWVCCQGCKNTITKDPEERWAVDPVSGKKVNKADAVLGKAPNDTVLFFENEKNRDAFVPTPTPVEKD